MLRLLKKGGYYFGIPFGCLFFYVFFCMFLQRCNLMSTMTSMFVGDMVCSVLFGLLFYYLCVKPIPKEERKMFRFTGFSLFCLFILFVWQYVFGQATSAWVGVMFPSNYINTYNNMSSDELMVYLCLAVTFAPVVEELLFRGLFYKHLRKRFGLLFSFIFSTFMFMISHGTTEHLPLTLALSALICFVYEITGNIRYCILIHMLSNLVSMAYIVQVPISFAFCVAMFVIYILFMFGLFACIPILREKMRYDANKLTFSQKLEEKRKHWGDIDNE